MESTYVCYSDLNRGESARLKFLCSRSKFIFANSQRAQFNAVESACQSSNCRITITTDRFYYFSYRTANGFIVTNSWPCE